MHGNASCFMDRICINKSLLDTFKDHPEEILAVLCHEIGHSKKYHLIKNTVVDIVYMILFRVFLQQLLLNPSYLPAFGFEHKSLFINLALSIKMFQSSFDLFLRMGMNKVAATAFVLPHIFPTVKSGCFAASGQHTCPKTSHSCWRRIIDSSRPPGKAAWRTMARAVRGTLSFLHLGHEV